MRKTPSYLKGLAETRARAAGDIARLEILAKGIAEQIERARHELDACDTLIKKFDSRLNPDLIQPVRAWKGRYGQRGALKAAILAYFEAADGAEVTTTELLLHLQMKFGLDFQSAAEAKRWRANTLLRRLKVLVSDGVLRRTKDAGNVATGELARWCQVRPAASLEQLVAGAQASGVEVKVGEPRGRRRKT